MPDEKGVSRRERNERFSTDSPPLFVPDEGRYLWEWYEQLSSGVRRVEDGVCGPIPWSEYLAWSKVIGHIVRPREYAILRAMDEAFCTEMNKELADFRERQNQKAKDEAAKGGKRKR